MRKIATSPLSGAVLSALVVFIAALLSYQFNFFHTTEPSFFQTHQLDSEQLILDGISNAEISAGRAFMGRYEGPQSDQRMLMAHEVFASRNRDGNFVGYHSQFGLQFYAFNAFARHISDNVFWMQFVCSLLLALVVAVFYLAFTVRHSYSFSIPFAATLILSPWVVVFARNLYWVEWTWFLPAMVTAVMGLRCFHRHGVLFILLLLAFLIKFLCGYEYITSIGLAACAYPLYLGMSNNLAVVTMLRSGVVTLTAFLIALALSFSIHGVSASQGGVNGFGEIANIVSKRTGVASADDAITESCSRSGKLNHGCVELYNASLQASTLTVLKKYHLIPHGLPWLTSSPFDDSDAAEFKAGHGEAMINRVVRFFSLPVGRYYLGKVVLFLFVLTMPLALLYLFATRRYALACAGLLLWLSPLSWFVLAKGHSFIHVHMNYVLWYVMTFPMYISMLNAALFSKLSLKRH